MLSAVILRGLLVLQQVNLPRVREYRGDVAGDEVLALSDTQYQRGILARGDQLAGVLRAYHGDGVGALHVRKRLLHGLEEVAFVEVVDQVHDDLGVRLGDEL